MAKLLYQLIKSPIITEKAMQLAQYNQYVFEVDATANKIQLAQAFEQLFPGRKVSEVRVITIPSKVKRASRKPMIRKSYKKAIFTVVGEPLDFLAAGE